MTPPSSATALRVESAVFPPALHPPGTTNTLFLGGAGARGIEIQGNFVKVTAIGVYLEDKAIPSLAVKWKGYNVAELTDSVDFYRDIVTGPFEKLAQVTMILPLTGKQYSEKVSENCVAIWKALGMYTEAEATAVDKFMDLFKDQNFPPASSILFTISPSGSLTISFSKDNTIPEYVSVIENQKLAHAILESMIGKHGVSPEAKLSLASRLSDLMEQHGIHQDISKIIHDKPNASVEHEAIK